MKWADLLPIVLAALTVLGGGGGIWSLLTVRSQRRQLSAQATALEAQSRDTIATTVTKLGAAAAAIVEPLQKTLQLAEARGDALNAQLQAARGEVQQARGEVESARSEVAQLRAEAERAYEDLRRLRIAIMDPSATIAGLRALVDGLGTNGRL